jgi:hypothetical protein
MIGHLISSYRAMVKLGGAGSPSSWFDVQAHQIVRISDNGMPELRIIQAAGMNRFGSVSLRDPDFLDIAGSTGLEHDLSSIGRELGLSSMANDEAITGSAPPFRW